MHNNSHHDKQRAEITIRPNTQELKDPTHDNPWSVSEINETRGFNPQIS